MGDIGRTVGDIFSLGADETIAAATGNTPAGWIGKGLAPKKAPGLNADKALAAAAMEILAASRGTRKGYFDQLAQVLQGAISDARVRDVQFAAESNLRRGSDERRSAESTLATAGLARTPLGVSTRAGIDTAADQRVSTTAADFLNSLFLQSPNAVIGQAQQTGLQGMGTIADIGAQIAAQRAATQGQFIQGIGAGAGQLAGLGIQAKWAPTTVGLPASQ